MTIMARLCLVLYMGRIDGDTTSLLLGSLVDRGIVSELGASMSRENFGNSGRQCCLPMVNMTLCDISAIFLNRRVATYRWFQY